MIRNENMKKESNENFNLLLTAPELLSQKLINKTNNITVD